MGVLNYLPYCCVYETPKLQPKYPNSGGCAMTKHYALDEQAKAALVVSPSCGACVQAKLLGRKPMHSHVNTVRTDRLVDVRDGVVLVWNPAYDEWCDIADENPLWPAHQNALDDPMHPNGVETDGDPAIEPGLYYLHAAPCETCDGAMEVLKDGWDEDSFGCMAECPDCTNGTRETLVRLEEIKLPSLSVQRRLFIQLDAVAILHVGDDITVTVRDEA